MKITKKGAIMMPTVPSPIFEGPDKFEVINSLFNKDKEVEFRLNHESKRKTIKVSILGLVAKNILKETWTISFLYENKIYNAKCYYSFETKMGHIDLNVA